MERGKKNKGSPYWPSPCLGLASGTPRVLKVDLDRRKGHSQLWCKGSEGSLDWLSPALVLNLLWPALPPQLCDKQLPRSAVPQPGVLPLPSPGPEAGLQGPRGSPMVPGAAAHHPALPQLASSRPLCQPALLCLFSQFWIFECFVIIKPFLELLCGLWDQSEGTRVVPEGGCALPAHSWTECLCLCAPS